MWAQCALGVEFGYNKDQETKGGRNIQALGLEQRQTLGLNKTMHTEKDQMQRTWALQVLEWVLEIMPTQPDSISACIGPNAQTWSCPQAVGLGHICNSRRWLNFEGAKFCISLWGTNGSQCKKKKTQLRIGRWIYFEGPPLHFWKGRQLPRALAIDGPSGPNMVTHKIGVQTQDRHRLVGVKHIYTHRQRTGRVHLLR